MSFLNLAILPSLIRPCVKTSCPRRRGNRIYSSFLKATFSDRSKTVDTWKRIALDPMSMAASFIGTGYARTCWFASLSWISFPSKIKILVGRRHNFLWFMKKIILAILFNFSSYCFLCSAYPERRREWALWCLSILSASVDVVLNPIPRRRVKIGNPDRALWKGNNFSV